MADIKGRLDERWQSKRKKSFNWTKVIIMILVLVAILVVMNKLNQTESIKWGEQTPRYQTTPVDSAEVSP
ncbi:MAG TPA: hypothetical protein P5533_06870 [Candidatus Cloacimonadota bacterium]|nr:hypothetical protein [Candidatus Cloacimonadota bacterium]